MLTIQPVAEKQKSYIAFVVENANVRELFWGQLFFHGILDFFIFFLNIAHEYVVY